MKHVSSFVVFFFISSIVFAQSNKEDIDIIQSMFGKQKKELMQAYMTIPEDKKAGFWTLYDQYEADRKALGRERIAMIEAYANEYATMDDKKASELMNRKMKWVGDYAKFQKKYYDLMAKQIGGLQASKFMQLEDYLENNIRLYIQDQIPFIDELDKTKIQSSVQQ
jgi:AAA+ ATPase superfamily predicted ATPase